MDETYNADKTKEKKEFAKKYKRSPDFCFFCEDDVLNFGRHIIRNHSQEITVQNILALPPKSVERKHLIASLRKKGNFIKNSSNLFKPVHKSYLSHTEDNYASCPFCVGLYSRKLLWKHVKICPENKEKKCSNLIEAQNTYFKNYDINPNLKARVFPHMSANKISFVAKKDPLICAFGARYLNIHREEHQVNVCSRKMRELSKILIEARKVKPNIKDFFELLHPQHFDLIVSCVKVIAKYDSKTDQFLSPTYAMNISRSLKDCCDIAILQTVKRKYNYHNVSAATIEADFTMFKTLLETTWKYEISSQAGSDLSIKTWNKVTIVPLAADIKLFRQYLIDTGNGAEKKLMENSFDLNSFNLLMETVFSRLLLLNRKRVGELQRMKLSTYLHAEHNSKVNYEEFSDAISLSEKVLIRNFKRVVTRGKRGRGVPVLFSIDMQAHIDILIKTRANFLKKDNLYLFCNTKTENPITGYKIVQKHAKLCGAENPSALTSTRLRKHLATLTQIFNMSSNDLEQLATFMGHTIGIHSKSYRLPDDVYQTAKIAKLLMLMETGEAGKYKGMTLEEIQLPMEEEIHSETESVKDILENNDLFQTDIENHDENENTQTDNVRNETSTSNEIERKTKKVLVPWTPMQKEAVTDFFKNHIEMKKPPKRKECEELKKKYDILDNKSWTKIKVFVQNCYTKKVKY